MKKEYNFSGGERCKFYRLLQQLRIKPARDMKKKAMKKPGDGPTIDDVVKNAIMFFHKSIAEFESAPKFSLIHFCSAVELFLKARLMAEHWSLVISKIEYLDYKKFKNGDFISVTLNEAFNRLDKVVCSPVPEKDKKRFQELQSHRNRMVHFFHETDQLARGEAKKRLAGELCACWHILFKLLTHEWSDIFSKHNKSLNRLESEMRQFRDYLKAIFRALEPELKKLMQSGTQINKCPSCGFKSYAADENLPGLIVRKCRVCSYENDPSVIITCPRCNKKIEILPGGAGMCRRCKHKITQEELINVLYPEMWRDHNDGGPDYPAHCGECGSLRTVIPYEGKHLCVDCFTVYDDSEIDQCEYCADLNAGLKENSYLVGCVACEGKFGNDRYD